MLPETIKLHEVVDIIIATLNARDPYTFEHSERVAFYSEELARSMGLSPCEIQEIHIAAHLHDIGKIAVSDAILRKEGPLSDEEYREMKKHPQEGAVIVEKIPSFRNLASIIESHHERHDGGGYPCGLREEEIPRGAQIIAVADTFDAITSRRPYRDRQRLSYAIKEIERGRGSQFNPDVVDAFNRCQAVFIEFHRKQKEG